jgi:hypothetical protein
MNEPIGNKNLKWADFSRRKEGRKEGKCKRKNS